MAEKTSDIPLEDQVMEDMNLSGEEEQPEVEEAQEETEAPSDEVEETEDEAAEEEAPKEADPSKSLAAFMEKTKLTEEQILEAVKAQAYMASPQGQKDLNDRVAAYIDSQRGNIFKEELTKLVATEHGRAALREASGPPPESQEGSDDDFDDDDVDPGTKRLVARLEKKIADLEAKNSALEENIGKVEKPVSQREAFERGANELDEFLAETPDAKKWETRLARELGNALHQNHDAFKEPGSLKRAADWLVKNYEAIAQEAQGANGAPKETPKPKRVPKPPPRSKGGASVETSKSKKDDEDDDEALVSGVMEAYKQLEAGG